MCSDNLTDLQTDRDRIPCSMRAHLSAHDHVEWAHCKVSHSRPSAAADSQASQASRVSWMQMVLSCRRGADDKFIRPTYGVTEMYRSEQERAAPSVPQFVATSTLDHFCVETFLYRNGGCTALHMTSYF